MGWKKIMKATITHYSYQKLGHANHGWLDARYHFSFVKYWNPKRTHFGMLRVINDDMVQAGRGFALHSHDNMEIITYVKTGAITHRDSMGNEGRTNAGDVQVMSAGSGITHSEMNNEPIETTLYQIWIESHTQNVTPRWDAKEFPKETHSDGLLLLVSGQPEHKESGALFIHQDAAIYGGKIPKSSQFTQTIKHQAYVLASKGGITLSLKEGASQTLTQGDGAEITNTKSFIITANSEAEIIVIDVPPDEQN